MLTKSKIKKAVICAVSVVCMTSVFAFSACGTSEKNDDNSQQIQAPILTPSETETVTGTETITNNIVSYVDSDSKVYNSTAEIVSAVADTVVEISTETVVTNWMQQYIESGAGSGVLVGKSETTYYIVTNNHVIDGANEITVRTRSGDEYEAALVATDDSVDIAVITITSETELSLATWGNSDDLQVGEDLIAIGNPLGSLGGTVTKGILSAKGRSITVGNYEMTLLQTDTAINPGNSGGGLFNMKGQLIGIVNAKTSDEEVEGICFAIPANSARQSFTSLVEHGYIEGRATFNIGLSSSSSSSSTFLYVISVEDGSQFALYDKIYKINGEEVTSVLEYNVAMSKIKAGDTVEVEVYHGKITQHGFGYGISFDTTATTLQVTASQYGA